jgi:hypothetical protein
MDIRLSIINWAKSQQLTPQYFFRVPFWEPSSVTKNTQFNEFYQNMYDTRSWNIKKSVGRSVVLYALVLSKKNRFKSLYILPFDISLWKFVEKQAVSEIDLNPSRFSQMISDSGNLLKNKLDLKLI